MFLNPISISPEHWRQPNIPYLPPTIKRRIISRVYQPEDKKEKEGQVCFSPLVYPVCLTSILGY
jgi:hypothetical protein